MMYDDESLKTAGPRASFPKKKTFSPLSRALHQDVKSSFDVMIVFSLRLCIILCIIFLQYHQSYYFNGNWAVRRSKILSSERNQQIISLRDNPTSSASIPLLRLDSENSTESLFQLIRFGDRWLAKSPLHEMNINQLSPDYVTVFGCLANVKIRTEIDSRTTRVSLLGMADSKVALGMLAYIAEVS